MSAELFVTATRVPPARKQGRSATGPRSQRVKMKWAVELNHVFLSSEALRTGTVRAP